MPKYSKKKKHTHTQMQRLFDKFSLKTLGPLYNTSFLLLSAGGSSDHLDDPLRIRTKTLQYVEIAPRRSGTFEVFAMSDSAHANTKRNV